MAYPPPISGPTFSPGITPPTLPGFGSGTSPATSKAFAGIPTFFVVLAAALLVGFLWESYPQFGVPVLALLVIGILVIK